MSAQDHLSQQQFFHVASPAHRDSISTHGLDWTRSPQASQPLQAYDDDGNVVDLPRANYLYRTEASARERAGSTGEDIYQVHGAGLQVQPDPYEDTEAVLTYEPVSPSRLSRQS